MTQRKPPSSLLRNLRIVGASDSLFQRQNSSTLSTGAGAYVLILGVEKTIPIAKPKAVSDPLLAGWYVYAGSARGPGGIGARVARHLQRDKSVHWHIDQLTTRSDVAVWAVPLPDGTECGLVSELIRSGHFFTNYPGFGSSDCTRCAAHLLTWIQPD